MKPKPFIDLINEYTSLGDDIFSNRLGDFQEEFNKLFSNIREKDKDQFYYPTVEWLNKEIQVWDSSKEPDYSDTHLVDLIHQAGRDLSIPLIEYQKKAAEHGERKKLEEYRRELPRNLLFLLAEVHNLGIPYSLRERDSVVFVKISTEFGSQEIALDGEPWEYESAEWYVDKVKQKIEDERRKQQLREQAKAKLTPEELEALGL